MAVSYKGYGSNCITMEKTSDTMSVGNFVGIDSNGQLTIASETNAFFGVIVAIRGNYVTVQTSGYYEAELTGSVAPTSVCLLTSQGVNKVSVDDTESATNIPRKVIKYNKTTNVIGFLI